MYYWVVLRVLDHQPSETSGAQSMSWDGGPHNPGARIAPTSVLVQYLGNPVSNVVAMPPLLRLVTGDAHATTTPATGATPAQWSCSGYTDRTTVRYPRCPKGSDTLRTFEFPSCWDGRHIDSPTHRTHAVFPAADGTCPPGIFPIPRLRLQIAYTIPAGHRYAIDSFPDEHRSPTTDHADFVNVMPDKLMTNLVACLNTGQQC